MLDSSLFEREAHPLQTNRSAFKWGGNTLRVPHEYIKSAALFFLGTDPPRSPIASIIHKEKLTRRKEIFG